MDTLGPYEIFFFLLYKKYFYNIKLIFSQYSISAEELEYAFVTRP